MGVHAGQRVAEQAAQVDAVTSSVTGDAGAACLPVPTDMLGSIDAAVRIRLELIARASASPQAALPHAIALLVDGPAEQQAAIIEAFTTNDALRAQWHDAWSTLRR